MGANTAGKIAWNLMTGFTGNKSEGATFRILLSFVLLVGIFVSFFTIYRHVIYTPPEIIIPEGQVPAADIKRLSTMIKSLNGANDARSRSIEVADANALIGRYPFSSERTVAVDDIIDTDSMSFQPFVVPPGVHVKATLFLEKKAAAVLDIEGEPNGKIYRAGDKFAGERGLISRITRENITVIYEGKEFVFTP